MNVLRQKIIILMTLLIGACLVAGGCSSQKLAKPMPGTPKEVANLVETEAGKVEGVSQATALVADKTIYVGLEMKEKMNEQQAKSIEQSVLDRMTYLEPNYNIGVSSDLGIVGKIKAVAMGFAQGNPLSKYSNEITQIDQGVKLKNQAIEPGTGRQTVH